MNHPLKSGISVFMLFLLAGFNSCRSASIDQGHSISLQTTWQASPIGARPLVYWHWLFSFDTRVGFQASVIDELPEEFLALCHEKGLHLELFEVEGATAFVLIPSKSARGNPWVWYAPTVERQPNNENFWYFERLLNKGISIAGYHIGEVRGAPASTTQFSRFYDAMLQKGYASKPVLLGQSRGGLMLLSWAIRNPGKVKAFAGIFPVCNLTSWPLKNSKEQVLNDYGLSETELLQNMSQFNPTDNLHGLAQNRVPMFIVHGDDDKLVPYEDNTGLLLKNYRDLGGLIGVELIPGEGHKVSPSFFESKALLRFVVKQSQ